jgi:hypothetical protein
LCFLPAGGYLFTQKLSEVCAPGHTDGTVQLMRALWAAWFFKGGVPATAKELRAIVEDLVADLKQGSDPLAAETGSDTLVISASPQNAEFNVFMNAKSVMERTALMGNISAEAILDDVKWARLSAHFVNQGLQEKQIPLFRAYLSQDIMCDANNGGSEWETHTNVPRSLSRDVQTNLWILQFLKKSTKWSLDVDDLLSAVEVTDADDSLMATKPTIFAVLEVLILAPLFAKGEGAGRTSAMPHSRDVLEVLTERWSKVVLDQDMDLVVQMDVLDSNTKCPFFIGRSFLDCTSAQAKMIKTAADAQRKATLAMGLIKMKNVDRREAQVLRAAMRKKHEDQRAQARSKAKKEELQKEIERWDILEKEAVDVRDKTGVAHSGAGELELGMDPFGYGVVRVPKEQLLSLEQKKAEFFTDPELEGMRQANLFFADIRHKDDPAAFLASYLELAQAMNPKCPVALFINADQVGLAHRGLLDAAYDKISLPYVMKTTLSAHTLSTQRATEVYNKHPMLEERAQQGVPYGTPFGVILRASTTDGRPPRKDRTSLLSDAKSFQETMDKECPRLLGSHPDKHEFSIDLSRYWQIQDAAAVCKQYPTAYAFSNWIWWNLRQDDLVVVCSEDPTFPLVAIFGRVRVLAIDSEKEEALKRGMQTMAYLRHPMVQKRYNPLSFSHPPSL